MINYFMDINSHTFPNFGYLTARLPNDVLKNLASVIDSINKSPEDFTNYSDRLVASIKHSYDLIEHKHLIEGSINSMIAEYDKQFPGYLISQDLVSKRSPIGIADLWVNFQKSGDVNPNHCHPGIFSFVIWMYIPYRHEDQNRDIPGAKLNGSFEFTYTQTNGVINHISINADKEWQGICCLFPSSLQHCVYPFFSDNNSARITVSGNVKFLVDD
jgi:hypothetical protein